jgi:hypothetical protein
VPKALWHFHQGDARVFPMSTIAEIEAAIELLSPQQVEELAIWLNSLRAGREKPVSADAWLSRARGAARPGVTSAEVLALTRHEG